jgi:hypothetical protein
MIAELVISNGVLGTVGPLIGTGLIALFTWVIKQITTLSANNREMVILLTAMKEDLKDVRDTHRADLKDIRTEQSTLTALVYSYQTK